MLKNIKNNDTRSEQRVILPITLALTVVNNRGLQDSSRIEQARNNPLSDYSPRLEYMVAQGLPDPKGSVFVVYSL